MTQQKRRLKNLVILFILIVLIVGWIGIGLKQVAEERGSVGKEQAIEIANNEAVSLGYDLSKMKVEYSRKGNRYEVYFWQPGVLGGDLTVSIETKTGKVLNTLQGQ